MYITIYSFYAKGHLLDKIAPTVRLQRAYGDARVSLSETKKARCAYAQRAFPICFVSYLTGLVGAGAGALPPIGDGVGVLSNCS